MSDSHKKIEHPCRFKTGQSNPMYNKTGQSNPMYNKPKPEGAGRPSQQVEVFDLEEKTTTTYNSMDEAARALNLPSYKIISNYILRNQKKPYKGRYTFKKVN